MLRTRIYIDGYNLYYGCLKGTHLKWLNLLALFEKGILPSVTALVDGHAITSKLQPVAIKFFTAPILEQAAKDSDSIQCQEQYHAALSKHQLGRVETIKGYYSLTEARAKIIDPLDPKKWPRDCLSTDVWKLEEKQTDVNLALHAVKDALLDGSRHTLIAVLLEESSKLIATPEGLRLVLPELYTAMVGTSTLVRASAAETLGRAGRKRSNDLPELVLEAFILLLEDQYVIVHKAAAKALESISLTGALEQRAGRALLTLLRVYGNKGKVESFLLDWMQLYFRRYTADDASRANLARWCLKVLTGVSVHMHLRDLTSLSKYLKGQPTFVDLVIRALEDPEVSDHGQEDVIRLLHSIPDAEASKRSADLSKLSVRRADRGWYVGAVVEVLTRVGAWDEAVEAIESSWEAIPDTVPMRRIKWSRRLHVVAVQFEAAVAAGDLSRQDALKAEWEGLYQLLKEDQEKYAERRNPFPGVFRPNSGS